MLKRLFSKTTTPTEIADSLEKARADLTAAETAVEAAQARYDDGLLSLERAALRQLQDEKADAQIDLDHNRALVSRLEAELERATDVEAESTRRANYDRAAELSAAAQKRMLKEYPRAAETIRGILAAIAEADVAVLAVNQDLQEGAVPLTRPEDIRSTPNLYRSEISNEVVELWAAENSQSSPLEPHLQRQVQAESRLRRVGSRYDDEPPVEEITVRGTVRVDSGGYLNVVRRRFIKRTFVADRSGRHIPNLAAEVNLPPLYASAGSYWKADHLRPDGVLAELAKPIRQRPEDPARVPEIEYQLVRSS